MKNKLYPKTGEVAWWFANIGFLFLFASYMGWIGLSLGLLEPGIMLLAAGVLFYESIVEDAKKLGKMQLVPLLSLAAFLSTLVYGGALLFQLTDIVSMLSPFKAGIALFVEAMLWIERLID